jgi:hypothetical protein
MLVSLAKQAFFSDSLSQRWNARGVGGYGALVTICVFQRRAA